MLIKCNAHSHSIQFQDLHVFIIHDHQTSAFVLVVALLKVLLFLSSAVAASTSIGSEHGTVGMPHALPSGASLGERERESIEINRVYM